MQDAEMEMSSRLREARVNAGYESAATAARRLGIPYGTYSGHENGNRGIKSVDITRYARAFGVSRSWLQYGQDIKYFHRDSVEIIGEGGVLPEGEIRLYSDDDPGQTILLPRLIDKDISGIFVKGKLLAPYAFGNNLILFESKFTSDIASFSGFVCVCILKDQRVLIRKPIIVEGNDNCDLEFTLYDTLRNVEIERVAPVLFIMSGRGYLLARDENMKLADKLDAMAQEIDDAGSQRSNP